MAKKHLEQYDKDGNRLDIYLNDDEVMVGDQTLADKLDDMDDAIEDASDSGYAPPEGGIPKTDLAQSVQDTLDAVSSKANDNAVVKSISVNGQNPQTPTNGNVDISVAAEVSFDDVFGKVWYDSTNKKIKFYSKDATFNNGVPAQDAVVIAELDAADFIKDGMVHSVEVKDADVDGETVLCVVITFNTDAEQEDINIPVSQIFDTSLYYKKSETYNKTETDTALGNKVDAVALNGNVLSYTKHGQSTNVATFKTINGQSLVGNGSISIPAGTTPRIDPVSKNWLIGAVDTGVCAKGEKGDSGVASGDGVRVVNDLNGDPADLQQGQVAVLSANMGKELSMGILAGKGNFADAYDCAMENPTTVFPWMLIDEDFDGNKIRKMIWHIGNGVLIDAIGAEMNGARNGYVTIRSNAAGSIEINGLGIQDEVNASLPIIDGEVNYSFAQIADLIKTANNSSAEYDGSSFGIRGISGDATRLDIDFGWADIKSFANAVALKCKVIRKMTNNGHFGCQWLADTSKDPILREIQMSGTFYPALAIAGSGSHKFLCACKYLEKADLSGMTFGRASNQGASFQDFLSSPSTQSGYALKYVDIRGLDGYRLRHWGAFGYRSALKTLIIGNLYSSDKNQTSQFMQGVTVGVNTDRTLVCTTDTPPNISVYDYIAGHFSSIKVPNKTVEVDGQTVSVLDIYKNHVNSAGDAVGTTGWSKYKDIMSTYEEGEY